MAETADMCPLSLAVDFFPRPSVLTVARTFLINSNLDPMEWIGLFGTGSLMRNLFSLSLSVVFITVCAVLPCAVQGQTQDSQTQQNQSVAEVARRNREQMKNWTQSTPSPVRKASMLALQLRCRLRHPAALR